ncbi:MAG: sugar ABC transporter permease [Actinomycetota bacterium]|nr:sugar ABC transporter permease [Actinomycetota bacterium]
MAASDKELEARVEAAAKTGGQRGMSFAWRRAKKQKIVYPPQSPKMWLKTVGWRHLIAIIAAMFAIYPVLYIVSSSLSAQDNLAGASLIPKEFSLDSYREFFKPENPNLTPFTTWLRNSWIVALVAASLNVALAAMAAYAFSRFRFKGRRTGLLGLLLVQIFPQFLAFVAILLIMINIGNVFPAIGLDTLAGLTLVYLGGAIGFNTFLIKGFMDSVPESLDESARVDGAGVGTIYWRIILPLARPALAVIFVISFIGLFGEFLLARTLLSSTDNFTLAVGLQLFTNADYGAKWGLLSASVVVAALPIVLTFLVAQRAIVSGLTGGAVKG